MVNQEKSDCQPKSLLNRIRWADEQQTGCANAKRVLSHLVTYAGGKDSPGWVFADVEGMCRKMEISYMTFSRAIKRLEDRWVFPDRKHRRPTEFFIPGTVDRQGCPLANKMLDKSGCFESQDVSQNSQDVSQNSQDVSQKCKCYIYGFERNRTESVTKRGRGRGSKLPASRRGKAVDQGDHDGAVVIDQGSGKIEAADGFDEQSKDEFIDKHFNGEWHDEQK